MSLWPPQKKVFTVGFITGGVTPVMVNFVWPAAQPQKKINYNRKKIFPAAAFQKIIFAK
ncbi:DP60R [African swine fever virus]|nr:DP60R [African swine fever virus]WGG63128.1 DP60R [African swine fever virus]WGG63295.1 DP60R [African swine fever virus]